MVYGLAEHVTEERVFSDIFAYGELLALTLEDFDEEEKTLRINKSY